MIHNKDNNLDLDKLEIQDVIDINALQKFQDNFADSMGIASVTVDRKGKAVTKSSSCSRFCAHFVRSTAEGNEKCIKAHQLAGREAARTGRPYIFRCHAGLIDFAAPILIKGIQIGTVLGGQILIEAPVESDLKKTAQELGLDEDQFFDLVKEIKIVTRKNVEATAEVLFTIANTLSKIGYEELELKKVSKELETEVVEKNLLLEEANEYNKLKTQLFSTMSHELKTPVNIIYSAIQLVENAYKGNMQADTKDVFLKYSRIMKQNCYRLIRLTNNLIDMNKIELGFYCLELKNNNIVKAVEDITLSVIEYARLKNIELIFDTEDEDIIIAFDIEKLERIMLNLLSNAIKFTEPNGKIKVSVYNKNQYIAISVKDNGIGIPDNMHDKIFETFTQVDGTMGRNAEGSGIGLSLVKSLVKMHKGEITVKSKEGEGSEFIISLPKRLVESDDKDKIYEGNLIKDNKERAKIEFSDIYI